MSQLKGIEITLKPIAGGVNRVLPSGINQIVQQEYANKYLESIGAYPTKDNIDFVLNNLAIKDALVLPIWARSKIIIIPGMNNKEGELGQSMQDFLSENVKEKDVTRRSDKKKTRTPKVSSDDFADQDEIHRNAKSSYTNLVGRRLSWTTVNTLDLLEPLMNVLQGNRRIAESFKVLMKPPDFDLEDIQRSLYTFITSLPDYVPRVKHDKTFQLFKSIRKLLKSKECVQLYGLLIHFCYWNIIHPTARHTIQSLRERGLSKPTGVFDDLDLSTQGMLQVRNQTGAQSSSAVPTGQHSALSVERMFAEGMLSVADDGVEMIQVHDPACSPSYYQHQHQHEEQISSNSSSSSRMNSRSRTCSGSGGYDIHIADGLQALEASSRPGSPEFGVSANGSDKLGFSSRPSSPDHDGTNGSKKVDFNLSRSVHSRSPIMGNRSMDAGFEDGNGSVEGSLNGSITGGAYGGSPTARTRFPNGGGGGSLSGVSVETEASLSAFEKEQLFVHLEACLIHLFKKVGRKRIDLVTGRQALVSCCHFVVDEALTLAYPWFATLPEDAHPQVQHQIHVPLYRDFANRGLDWTGHFDDSIKKLNLRLRRLVHQGMADIIDPSRLYTSSILLTSLTGKVQNVSLATKGKSRFYTTSVVTKSLLGDTHSDAARRFIQQGRGVYTVLPGVADQHDNTLLTGGPYAVGSDNFFDILRRQQEDNPPQPYGAGATQEPHYRDAPPPRYSSGSSKFAKNKFSGHYFSSGGGEEAQQQRPNTTTGVSRNPSRAASATQLGATRSGTANAALHHKDNHHHQQQQHKQQKRLDFQNLFADQPAAGYFPVLKTGQMAAADLAAHSASSKANDWLDEFLPPGSRGQSAGGGGAARGVGGSGSGRGSARGSGSAKIKVSEDFGTYMDLSDGWFGGDERPKSATFATSPKDQPVAGGAGYQDRVSNSAPVSTAPMFPSGESVSSNSYLSENRSIAHNKAASMPLSLRAKASLMELMVDKTTSLYATDIQTNVIKTRLALLKPTVY